MAEDGSRAPGPLRAEDLVRSLPGRFRPDRAGDLAATFHLALKGAEPAEWTVHVGDGGCRVDTGHRGSPDCVVRMKATTYVAVETGETSPQAALLTGRIRVSDLALMRRFASCFTPAGQQVTVSRREPADPGPTHPATGPLAGILVVDLARMLPGAVLARQLIDLGARLVKVEDPDGGDPMRQLPPLAGGIGAGFASLLRGAESIALDLTAPADASLLRRLVLRADVVVDSFRPGTLEGWGLDRDELTAAAPRLVWCSLPSYGREPEVSSRVAHDLNLTALTGLLSAAGIAGVPAVQVADVGTGLLAASAILAALLQRERSGRGAVLDQPLITGPLPFVTWGIADAAAGPDSVLDTVLAGRTPAYRRYRCGDGLEVAVGCIEPKFWTALVRRMGLPDLAGDGLDAGEAGRRATVDMARVFATRPRQEWLDLAAADGLPLSPVHDLATATADPVLAGAGVLESTPTPDGGTLTGIGPLHPSLGRTPRRPAPLLGQDTARLLAELDGGDQP